MSISCHLISEMCGASSNLCNDCSFNGTLICHHNFVRSQDQSEIAKELNIIIENFSSVEDHTSIDIPVMMQSNDKG